MLDLCVAMDCTQPTPRVNGAQLRLMEGKVVRLVGQVTAHEGATVTLECADGEKVSVQQTAGSAYETKYGRPLRQDVRLTLSPHPNLQP